MTALISVIPILLLIVLMMGFHVSGYKSALATIIVTILLALFAVPSMGIIPEKFADASIYGITLWSVLEGVLKACFPIILIIIFALFSYNILCETKEIETIKTQFIRMTSDKGLLVLLTGSSFPFFAPLIGTIGTFVTGSATNANILFGKLQATAAHDLGLVNQGTFFGVAGNETHWLAAANCAGSEGGKLISPQSIAIATAACDMEGQDGDIMRKTLPFAIFWVLMNGVMVFLGLHVF
jgi:L-lactate permease